MSTEYYKEAKKGIEIMPVKSVTVFLIKKNKKSINVIVNTIKIFLKIKNKD